MVASLPLLGFSSLSVFDALTAFVELNAGYHSDFANYLMLRMDMVEKIS